MNLEENKMKYKTWLKSHKKLMETYLQIDKYIAGNIVTKPYRIFPTPLKKPKWNESLVFLNSK